MSNEKQQKIVEMAKDICRHQNVCTDVCKPISARDALRCAERAVEAGYVKQKEGEWRSELRERCDWRGKKQLYYQPNSCSVCHEAVVERTPFCPYCGARMRGDKNE